MSTLSIEQFCSDLVSPQVAGLLVKLKFPKNLCLFGLDYYNGYVPKFKIENRKLISDWGNNDVELPLPTYESIVNHLAERYEIFITVTPVKRIFKLHGQVSYKVTIYRIENKPQKYHSVDKIRIITKTKIKSDVVTKYTKVYSSRRQALEDSLIMILEKLIENQDK